MLHTLEKPHYKNPELLVIPSAEHIQRHRQGVPGTATAGGKPWPLLPGAAPLSDPSRHSGVRLLLKPGVWVLVAPSSKTELSCKPGFPLQVQIWDCLGHSAWDWQCPLPSSTLGRTDCVWSCLQTQPQTHGHH